MNLNFLLGKKDNNLNKYGVVPVLFHIDCNDFGEHGTLLVTSRKRNIERAEISFWLKDMVELPPLTSKLLQEITAAAESQGYTVHHLISYVQLKVHTNPGIKHSFPGHNGPQVMPADNDRWGGMVTFPTPQEAGVPPSARVVMSRDIPGDVGSAALAAVQNMAKQPLHNFPVGSLAAGYKPDFEKAKIPAYLRAQDKELDESIQNLSQTPTFWMLNESKVGFQFKTLKPEVRQQLMNEARNIVRNGLKNNALQTDITDALSALVTKYETEVLSNS